VGTWGYALFSDDTACDVRDSYRELIQERSDIEDSEASRQILG
jgi:hypothetical protein